MKSPLKTAVIGVGNMGKNHVRIYSQISRLVGVVDVDKERAKQIAKQYRVNWYQSLEELLEREKPDAVSVAVPTKYHQTAVLTCLNRKIATLVEKPIADKITAAETMITCAVRNKTLLMVGHTERFNPAVIQLKKNINSKKFGTIVNLLAIRIGLQPPKIDRADVAVDLGIHDIDIMNYLLNELPTSKKNVRTALYRDSNADSSSFILQYKKATGVIHSNWVTPIKIRKLYVSGTQGFAELDYIDQKLIFYQKVTRAKKDSDYLGFLALSDTPKKIEYISKKEPLKQELKFFLKHYNDYKLNNLAEEAAQALKISLP